MPSFENAQDCGQCDASGLLEHALAYLLMDHLRHRRAFDATLCCSFAPQVPIGRAVFTNGNLSGSPSSNLRVLWLSMIHELRVALQRPQK
jgi:hypothetical protein